MGIFDQWNTKTLGGSNKLSVSDFELIQDGVHVQETNKAALELVELVGSVTNTSSRSGPMEDTTIEQVIQTSDVGFYTIFKPDAGVWKFIGGDLLTSGGTGTVKFSLFDGTLYAFMGYASVNGQEPLPTDTFGVGIADSLYVTPDLWLVGDASAIATSNRVTTSWVRVR